MDFVEKEQGLPGNDASFKDGLEFRQERLRCQLPRENLLQPWISLKV